MSHACLILSDAHLSRVYGHQTALALASLLDRHRSCELILAGDIFDLSLDSKRIPFSESVAAVLSAHPAIGQSLSTHLAHGGRVCFVPGNHDAALTSAPALATLRRAFSAQNDQQVQVSRWFLRRGGVHIEHGHLYDPDNAPNHPLGFHDPRTEPLGTALMRRFVAPNNAIEFAHAHETTPAGGLSRALRLFGPRAPWVIARYFATAFRLCAEAARGERTFEPERLEGAERLVRAALENGVDEALLRKVLELTPRPTHQSFRDTVLRLYFDRIFASLALAVGLGMAASAGIAPLLLGAAVPTSSGAGALLAALGAGYLTRDLSRSRSRYSNLVVPRVGEMAHTVREVTGADLVVLGHTHVPVNEPGYINLGSFGFARGPRPYLLLDTNGAHEVAQHAA